MIDELLTAENNRHPPLQTAVFDLQAGQLVAACGGRRTEYQAIEDVFDLPSLSPEQWTKWLIQHMNIKRFYLADLDALQANAQTPPTKPQRENGAPETSIRARTPTERVVSEGGLQLAQQILNLGGTVFLDMGCRNPLARLDQHDFANCWGHNRFSLVIPTEGLGLPVVAKPMLNWPTEVLSKVTLSLDLSRYDQHWFWFNCNVAFELAETIETLEELGRQGLRQVILLNLTDVGTGKHSTLPLLQQLAQKLPRIDWAVGGGISNQKDLQRFSQAGVHSALIGTWIWKQVRVRNQA